ncbi:hypothetical protein PG985_001342 [Apiospora marii]|uniref:uncharacterized protein n=1 Tax=Apiospora marii TaxID=335849 RepID=UPI00312D4D97
MGGTWGVEDIQCLLSSLNISVEKIRQWWPYEYSHCEKSSRKDRSVGISRACDHLATLIPAFTSRQIQRKMRWLWANFGPDDGDHEPDALYLQGAWNKTLPRLDGEFPDIWGRVNQSVEDDRKQLAQLRPSAPQENDQHMDYAEYVEPIKCRCGFSHVLGDTVQCTNPTCSRWQHVVCYYEVDDFTVAPGNHLCDQCRSADPQQQHWNLGEDHEMLQSAEEALASDPHADRPQAHAPYPEEPSNVVPIAEETLAFIHPHVERPQGYNPDTGAPSTVHPRIEEPPSIAPAPTPDVPEPNSFSPFLQDYNKELNNSSPFFQEPSSSARDQESNRVEPRPAESPIPNNGEDFDAPIQSLETDEAQILPAISSLPCKYDAFKQSLASFEQQASAASIRWAPDSDEIQSCLKKISLQCFNISKSLSRDGFLLAEVPTLDHLIQQMRISSCFAYSPNSNSESPSSRVTEKWLRAILVACAVDWIFYPGQNQTAQTTRDEPQSVPRLDAELNLILAHSFHTELANRCSPEALQTLHFEITQGLASGAHRDFAYAFLEAVSLSCSRAGFRMLYCEAVTRMLKDPDIGLPRALDREAKLHTERFFDRLMPFFTFGDSRAPLSFAPPHIGLMVEGESQWRISELMAVFSHLLRLKVQLSLSHSHYELWFPDKSPSKESDYLKGLVAPPNNEDDDDAPRAIEFCLCPAILEHKSSDATDQGILDISQCHGSFVRLTKEERSQARVICQAKVIYGPLLT